MQHKAADPNLFTSRLVGVRHYRVTSSVAFREPPPRFPREVARESHGGREQKDSANPDPEYGVELSIVNSLKLAAADIIAKALRARANPPTGQDVEPDQFAMGGC